MFAASVSPFFIDSMGAPFLLKVTSLVSAWPVRKHRERWLRMIIFRLGLQETILLAAAADNRPVPLSPMG